MDSHYNPLILSRLRPLAAGGDQVGLRAYLATLSHSHFRTAGHLLGERIMPALPVAAAWSLMHSLVEWQPKAFTVTTAKAMAPRLHSGEATVRDEGLRNLCASLQGVAHAIDRDKLLRTWLPVLREPDTVEAMLTMLPPEAPDGSGAVEALLRVPTAARTYALRALRREEHDTRLLAATCRRLMQRGDSLAAATAAIIAAYYGLTVPHPHAARHPEPCELAGIDTDYRRFLRVAAMVT